MAHLSLDSGPVRLRSSATVGRHPDSDLRLDRADVSARHATIEWNGASWTIRDLGSRNGTFVDSSRIAPGEDVPIRARTRVGFAAVDPAFELVDASAPVPFATSGGDERVGDDGLLTWEEADHVLVAIVRRDNGWWREGDELEPVSDRDLIVVGGRSWTVHLPSPRVMTRPTEAIELADATVRFRVSSDEEHVSLGLCYRGVDLEIGAFSFNYLLLTLGRARLEDRKDRSDAESGWVYRESLEKMLRCDREQLYLEIHRARRRLAAAGVAGAAGIIERRKNGAVRLGGAHIEVHRG